MAEETIISVTLFGAVFLALITLIQKISAAISFPYTIAVLIAGFAGQAIFHYLHIENTFHLSPDIIFYILLPALLFEASMHINLHQFRMQFKTISFLASFGLLVSLFVIGFGLSFLIGLPLGAALLFGALISATDPIAVLALFKTLGAPRRLALLADGESMFNDATGVIAFRIISVIVLTQSQFASEELIGGAINFIYVFTGSLAVGTLLGYITSRILPAAKNDRILVNTISTALAIGSFVFAEHFLHMSGVITTVMAGITVGNVGRNKLSVQVIHFIEEFWAFVGFVAVSLVFFFASFNLNTGVFFGNLLPISIAVLTVLIGRAVSVYLTSFISNNLRFFSDEPNIPMAWQHILNWGGLRGVIPLVLVYSLPDDYAYKEPILGFTLATLLFTLIINGLTIKWLLIKLKLNVAKKEEEIISDEMKLFEIEKRKEKLESLPKREFSQALIDETRERLNQKEQLLKDRLIKETDFEDFLKSLRVQSLEIEREVLNRLFQEGRFDENVYYYFESELDLQLDALEHPEVFSKNNKDGYINTLKSYRKSLMKLKRVVVRYPVLSKLFDITPESIIKERYQLLRARLFTSYAVLDYLKSVESIFSQAKFQKALEIVKKIQQGYISKNLNEINKISKEYPNIIENYQRRVIRHIIQDSGVSVKV